MHTESQPAEPAERAPTKRVRPGFVLAAALCTVLMTCGVSAAAMLAPAPAAVVPLIVVICAVAPLFAAWEAPAALAAFRSERQRRHGKQALTQLRAALDQLPEIEHPLGH